MGLYHWMSVGNGCLRGLCKPNASESCLLLQSAVAGDCHRWFDVCRACLV